MRKLLGILAATAVATIFTSGCSSTPMGPNTRTLGAAGSDLDTVTISAPSRRWWQNDSALTGGGGGSSSAYWSGGGGGVGGSAAAGGVGSTGASQ